MGVPIAGRYDTILGTDIHIVMVPSPGGPIPTPLPHPHGAKLDGQLSPDVNVEGRAVATKGSTATNSPPHVPQGGPFQTPPKNRSEVLIGSATVFVNGKPVARMGDTALTCNDPADQPVGQVIATSTVFAGG